MSIELSATDGIKPEVLRDGLTYNWFWSNHKKNIERDQPYPVKEKQKNLFGISFRSKITGVTGIKSRNVSVPSRYICCFSAYVRLVSHKFNYCIILLVTFNSHY